MAVASAEAHGIESHFGKGVCGSDLEYRLAVGIALPGDQRAVLEEPSVGVDHQIGLAHVLVVFGAEDAGEVTVTGNEGSELLIADDQILIHHRQHAQHLPFFGGKPLDQGAEVFAVVKGIDHGVELQVQARVGVASTCQAGHQLVQIEQPITAIDASDGVVGY